MKGIAALWGGKPDCAMREGHAPHSTQAPPKSHPHRHPTVCRYPNVPRATVNAQPWHAMSNAQRSVAASDGADAARRDLGLGVSDRRHPALPLHHPRFCRPPFPATPPLLSRIDSARVAEPFAEFQIADPSSQLPMPPTVLSHHPSHDIGRIQLRMTSLVNSVYLLAIATPHRMR